MRYVRWFVLIAHVTAFADGLSVIISLTIIVLTLSALPSYLECMQFCIMKIKNDYFPTFCSSMNQDISIPNTKSLGTAFMYDYAQFASLHTYYNNKKN